MSRCDTQEWRLWDREVEAAGCCVMVRLRSGKMMLSCGRTSGHVEALSQGCADVLGHHYA